MRCGAFEESGRVCDRSASEVAPEGLLALDRLEQSLEVARAEALGPLPLNDLVEQCRTVFDRLGEDLQQISFVVAIDQDTELAEWRDVFIDMSDAVEHRVVVRG